MVARHALAVLWTTQPALNQIALPTVSGVLGQTGKLVLVAVTLTVREILLHLHV